MYLFKNQTGLQISDSDIQETIKLLTRFFVRRNITDTPNTRDLNKIFQAFANDPLVTCGLEDARKLFKEMCENTKEYLTMYDLEQI